MLERALRVIPLGSQTFSKSMVQYPVGISPQFATHAKGSRLWDADGNEFIDFVNGLACVLLGYGDEDVNSAVQRQLKNGVSFSLPSLLESEVAEAIVELIPCAEQVRFAKNGSDATSASVRVARAYTGRDMICVCGYHGWHDWYIGSTTRNLGVPDAVQALTTCFTYNDLNSLEQRFAEFPGNIAAVIMEPMNQRYPDPGFLESVKLLCERNGALLIFDETITGFRFSLGGAQELFKITPDLATFGKGIANGFPLSVISGRRELMTLFNEIFVSGTFGGETVSLAAAKATIAKIRTHQVPKTLSERGTKLQQGIMKLINSFDLESILSVSGHPCWSFLNFSGNDDISHLELKTLFLQELFRQGFLSIGTHNLSYAHSDEDIQQLLSAYEEILGVFAEVTRQGNINAFLKCKPLTPLFKVR